MTATDIAVIDSNAFDFAEMAAMLGQSSGSEGGDGLQRLRVNTEFEDDEGNPRPGGHWVLKVNGTEYFSKTVRFRALSQRFFYQKYDAKEEKIVNKTIYIRDFREESIDELGTVRCGKPDAKALKNAPESVLERYKNIKARRAVFGLVALIDPVLADGTKATEEIVNIPVEWVTGGASWNLVGDIFEEMTKKKVLMPQRDFVVGLKREKSGSTIYYTPQPEVDWDAPKLPMDPLTIDTWKHFEQLIADRNSEIKRKHKEAIRTSAKSIDIADDTEIVDSVLDGDFSDDLNDDIPL